MARTRGTTSIVVTFDGPFFASFRRYAIMNEFFRSAVERVTELTEEELRVAFGRKFKHPTGHFESQMQMTVVSDRQRVILDPVVYGPWLEGTSRRNRSTRFKGYKIWRLTRQKMRRLGTEIAQAIWDGIYAGRMNGI